MRSFLLATILLFAGSTVAVAQESYKGDAAATYEWVRANAGPGQCGCFGMNGGGLIGVLEFSRSLVFGCGHQRTERERRSHCGKLIDLGIVFGRSALQTSATMVRRET